ncbi:ImmA/IrrE family metallo-endopeptidase [Anaerostipes sp.]|uniref:ImmA/IrrE family metallo-endopeptidase n=1 Tax=Anaerostipes sp. TaxID=1872530 RepID=UPI0035297B30
MKQLRCLAAAWKKIEKNTVNIAILSAKREILLQFIFPHIINLNGEKMIIAQQLGHLFLHMGYQTNHNLWNHQKEGRFQEKNDPEQARQANSFAFALLMPEKEYRKMIDLNSEGLLVQTKNIAEYFGVSLAAAAQRGRELNILT